MFSIFNGDVITPNDPQLLTALNQSKLLNYFH